MLVAHDEFGTLIGTPFDRPLVVDFDFLRIPLISEPVNERKTVLPILDKKDYK